MVSVITSSLSLAYLSPLFLSESICPFVSFVVCLFFKEPTLSFISHFSFYVYMSFIFDLTFIISSTKCELCSFSRFFRYKVRLFKIFLVS